MRDKLSYIIWKQGIIELYTDFLVIWDPDNKVDHLSHLFFTKKSYGLNVRFCFALFETLIFLTHDIQMFTCRLLHSECNIVKKYVFQDNNVDHKQCYEGIFLIQQSSELHFILVDCFFHRILIFQFNYFLPIVCICISVYTSAHIFSWPFVHEIYHYILSNFLI